MTEEERTVQTAETENVSLEETFAALDGVLEKLNGGGTSLEESFALYAKGMELVRACNEKIDRVEKQCLVISENGEDHEL